MKVVQRIRRSRAAAGASLATTPVALNNYRSHFAGQFQNNFGVDDVQNQNCELRLIAEESHRLKNGIVVLVDNHVDRKSNKVLSLITARFDPLEKSLVSSRLIDARAMSVVVLR